MQAPGSTGRAPDMLDAAQRHLFTAVQLGAMELASGSERAKQEMLRRRRLGPKAQCLPPAHSIESEAGPGESVDSMQHGIGGVGFGAPGSTSSTPMTERMTSGSRLDPLLLQRLADAQRGH